MRFRPTMLHNACGRDLARWLRTSFVARRSCMFFIGSRLRRRGRGRRRWTSEGLRTNVRPRSHGCRGPEKRRRLVSRNSPRAQATPTKNLRQKPTGWHGANPKPCSGRFTQRQRLDAWLRATSRQARRSQPSHVFARRPAGTERSFGPARRGWDRPAARRCFRRVRVHRLPADATTGSDCLARRNA